MSTQLQIAGRRFSRQRLVYGVLLVNTELLVAAVYGLLVPGILRPYRYGIYGLLWVTVGLWAIATTDIAPASSSTKRRAAAVAGLYFVAIAWAGGLLIRASKHGAPGAHIGLYPIGWGPALVYHGTFLNVVAMPAHVVGYAALAYLVYATIVDASGTPISGILGMLSCVSCSWPLLAGIVTTFFGSSAALASTTLSLSYDLSTLVFLVTVALLVWRPLNR